MLSSSTSHFLPFPISLSALWLLLIYFWLKRKLPLRPEDFSLRCRATLLAWTSLVQGQCVLLGGLHSQCPLSYRLPICSDPCILGLGKHSAHHRLPIRPTVSHFSPPLYLAPNPIEAMETLAMVPPPPEGSEGAHRQWFGVPLAALMLGSTGNLRTA